MRININLFGLFKIFIVFAMLGFGLYQIIITQDENFVATEASLLEAYSETYKNYSQGRHQTKTRYYFKYKYIFKDKVYTSERYTHVNPSLPLGVNRFKGSDVGTRFTVYVNPGKPSYAVVQNGQPLYIYILALTGLSGALNCLIEWWFDRLHNSKLEKNKQRIEQVRKFLVMTGALTAIGIFATLLMYLFAV